MKLTLVRNPFANVARIIAKIERPNRPPEWLESALRELAANVVEADIHNAKFVPLRSEVRTNIKALKKAAARFASALDCISLLEMPADGIECLPRAGNAARSIISLCDNALSINPGKAGAPKQPGRTICAFVIVEAWSTTRRGKAPSKNDLTAQSACDFYWQACDGPPTSRGEYIDWGRHIEEARKLKDAPIRVFIRNEMQRYRMGT